MDDYQKSMNVKQLLTILLFCSMGLVARSQSQHEPQLIAHACGQLDGYNYTNSVEALENSIKNGYKFIEVDLLLTSDSIPVGCHTWEEWNEIIGSPEMGGMEPSFEDFSAKLLYGKYKPVTCTDIVYYLENFPDWTLVLDKLDDVDILEYYLGDFKDRILVECFSEYAYKSLRLSGFRPMLAGYRDELHKLFAYSLESMVQGEAPVDYITWGFGGDLQMLRKYECLMPFKVAGCTSDDEWYIYNYIVDDVDLVYTNSIIPRKSE